ncbi:MAG: DoxX family protein [Alphaproteobacteria bacterium]|nr:DoxX family protein [Alphaproteobacteria bacterium]
MIDTRLAPYAALILRVSMGLLFIAHGLYLKVFVFGMAGTVGFFGSIGYPPSFAWLVMLAETLGGIALVLGFHTRLVSLALVPIMLGALMVHLPNGWLFSAPNGGFEYPLFWTAALLVQAMLGGGAHALTGEVGLPASAAAPGAPAAQAAR